MTIPNSTQNKAGELATEGKNMNNIGDLPEFLGAIRRMRDLSFDDLGNLIGISADRLRRFEKKESAILGLDEVQEIANGLGVKAVVTISGDGVHFEGPIYSMDSVVADKAGGF